jgi:hypothetical protein
MKAKNKRKTKKTVMIMMHNGEKKNGERMLRGRKEAKEAE